MTKHFSILAPISSILVKKLGCRWTMILGAVLTIVSLGSSYFSTQPWHAVVLFSIICGKCVHTYIKSRVSFLFFYILKKTSAALTIVTGF